VRLGGPAHLASRQTICRNTDHGQEQNIMTKKDRGAKVADPADNPRSRAPEGRVWSEDHGMNYDRRNKKVVDRARSVPEAKWNTLPVETLPTGTLLQANEETLTKKSIDKVVRGAEPFREGYVIKLWRDNKGALHVVDGHHRVAMYHALGKPIPVRIMDEVTYQRLVGETS